MAQGVRKPPTALSVRRQSRASHTERKTILVEMNALLLTDIPVGERFTISIHMRSYSFDQKIRASATRNRPTNDVRRVGHYQTQGRRFSGSFTDDAGSPFPPFTTLPDGRSLFLGYTYNIAKLPEPMPARRADPRVGHFESQVWDFSTDTKFTARTHYVNRWRLEKKDPNADVSEPKEPIVFWIDRNVPEKYRPAVREGILEWNKAFEKIGFKDAIVVKQQEADATFDTFDARHSAVRWFVPRMPFRHRASTVDPRTGEILDAQVVLEPWSRATHVHRRGSAPRRGPHSTPRPRSASMAGVHVRGDALSK